MRTSFEHIAIFTPDLSASLHLYRDLLGGTVVRTGTIASSGTELAYLQYGTGIIELLAPPQTDKRGIDHIAFQVEDLDEAFDDMRKDGIRFTVEPKTAGSGVGRIAFLEDPDQIRVELLRQPAFRVADSELNAERLARDIDHVSLRVDDLDTSRNFYVKHFGARSVYVMEMSKNNMIIDYIDVGHGVLGLKAMTENASHPPGPRLAHVCLLVDDVERATETLSSAGIPFDVHPRQSAVGGGYKLAVCIGPEGTRIELQDRPDIGTFAETAKAR